MTFHIILSFLDSNAIINSRCTNHSGTGPCLQKWQKKFTNPHIYVWSVGPRRPESERSGRRLGIFLLTYLLS